MTGMRDYIMIFVCGRGRGRSMLRGGERGRVSGGCVSVVQCCGGPSHLLALRGYRRYSPI